MRYVRGPRSGSGTATSMCRGIFSFMSDHRATGPAAFGRLGVVLYRPKSPGNVGSVTRAMKNMGFERLVVAEPIAYEDPSHFDVEARRMAWNAADLLDNRTQTASLEEALDPFRYIVGTTSNPPPSSRVLTPREAASELRDRLAGVESEVAFLFGQEDIGLTRDALTRCHVVVRIPTSDRYDSLNLSQAVLICLYEIRLALSGADRHDRLPDASLPSQERLEAFYGRLEEALDAIGFFQGTGREHMMRELRLIFHRTVMSGRELAIFEGIAHRIHRMARRDDQEPSAR